MNKSIILGLSARDLILQFRHKVLLLFKLVLLEKKVVFHQSPVLPVCSAILTLLSLFPNMIESGLHEAACIRYFYHILFYVRKQNCFGLYSGKGMISYIASFNLHSFEIYYELK